MHIIEATSLQEIQLVTPLFNEYRIFYEQPSDEKSSYRFLYDRWVARESVLFLAMEEDAAIGFVHLYPFFLSTTLKRFWVLNDLYVAAGARRGGVARVLMRRAELHARETGSGGLTLSTAVDNFRAQSLYESEGYVKDVEFFQYNKIFDEEADS